MNRHINIVLRRAGERIWECRVECKVHKVFGLSAELDDKQKTLQAALDKLPCDCWK